MERAWKIVHIPYIVYIHCIHTQYNTQIHTQYSYKVYNKHTSTHVKTDGRIDEQADGGIYIFYIYVVYEVSLHSTHIQIHTQRTYIVYTQRSHGRTDGQMDLIVHIPYIVYIQVQVYVFCFIWSLPTKIQCITCQFTILLRIAK